MPAGLGTPYTHGRCARDLLPRLLLYLELVKSSFRPIRSLAFIAEVELEAFWHGPALGWVSRLQRRIIATAFDVVVEEVVTLLS